GTGGMKKSYFHYSLNGISPATAVNFSAANRTVTNTQSTSKLLTQFVTTAAANSLATGVDNADGSYSGGNGASFRMFACASTTGTTCSTTATVGEWIAVHMPTTNTAATMPPVTALSSISAGFRGVQVDSGSSSKVALFATNGVTNPTVTFTTSHGGTGQ